MNADLGEDGMQIFFTKLLNLLSASDRMRIHIHQDPYNVS